MSKGSSRRPDYTGSVIWGLILIGVGGWFLLDAIGISLPGIGMFWPIFPVVVGCAFAIGWLVSSNKRSSYGIWIPATINILVGLFFFAFTFGIFKWGDMAYLWPVFPLIVGISFVVTWVFSFFRDWGLLIPAGITGAVGVIGLAFTVGKLDSVVLDLIVKGWPVLLILIGLGTLVRGFFGRSGAQSAASPLRDGGGAVLEDYESVSAQQEETVVQEFKSRDSQDE